MSNYITDKNFNDIFNSKKEIIGNEEWNLTSHKSFNYDCCQNCFNNPKNNPNASGICHCLLPIMETIKY